MSKPSAPTTNPREHSILSASACERWWNCPGSANACKDIPNPATIYTAEGTVAHSLAEMDLREGGINFESSIGKIVKQDGFDIEITEEMVDAVNEYVGYIRDVQAAEGRYPLLLEHRVALTDINEVLFGTVDAAMVIPYKTVHVFDLKYGKGKRVSAWKNKQLMEYLLGIMLKEDCSEFVLHICQPRVEDGFSQYKGTVEEAMEFARELKEKAAAALSPNAPLIAGDWCRGTFCPNRTNCPALRELAGELVKQDFSTPAVVENMSLDHILKVLKYEDTVKDWMTRVREHAKELMLQGEDIPGYKVVQSFGHAKWVDEDVVIAEFEDEFGDDLYVKKLVSPAQFEKIAGKKRLGKSFREDYTVRPENGYKIVEDDAKGEPVTLIKPQEDFNE